MRPATLVNLILSGSNENTMLHYTRMAFYQSMEGKPLEGYYLKANSKKKIKVKFLKE